MKRKRSFIFILAVIFGSLVVGVAQITSRENFDGPLSLTINPIKGLVSSAGDAPLEIVFRNENERPVRILDVFDKPEARPIFFVVKISDAGSGALIEASGGGKISLSKDDFKYVELETGEEFPVNLNLKEFLPKDTSLKPGSYHVTITYRNQYGENCFLGSIESQATSFTVQ